MLQSRGCQRGHDLQWVLEAAALRVALSRSSHCSGLAGGAAVGDRPGSTEFSPVFLWVRKSYSGKSCFSKAETYHCYCIAAVTAVWGIESDEPEGKKQNEDVLSSCKSESG